MGENPSKWIIVFNPFSPKDIELAGNFSHGREQVDDLFVGAMVLVEGCLIVGDVVGRFVGNFVGGFEDGSNVGLVVAWKLGEDVVRHASPPLACVHVPTGCLVATHERVCCACER